jgi:hypothetical protein
MFYRMIAFKLKDFKVDASGGKVILGITKNTVAIFKGSGYVDARTGLVESGKEGDARPSLFSLV